MVQVNIKKICVYMFTEIDCGHPGDIANGKFTGATFTYGSSITYSCTNNYILVDGSTTRMCQITHTWTGTKPRCACMYTKLVYNLDVRLFIYFLELSGHECVVGVIIITSVCSVVLLWYTILFLN